MLKNEPSFQRYAFDPDLSGKRGVGELLRSLDGDELGKSGSSFGFQIKNIRRQDKETPEWAKTNEGIKNVLLTAFPKLRVDSNQRQKASRWARVIQLYFQIGWTWSEIAAEMNVKPNVVLMIIRGVKYTADGKTWNGNPRKRVR